MPALGLIVVVATLATTYCLGCKSIWVDEAFSYWIAVARWRALLATITSLDPSMPLYLLVLRPFVEPGATEATLRLISVIPAVATVPLVYLCGRAMFGSTAGLAASFLLAVNPFFVRYAQEARGYALVLFFVVAATYLLVGAVERRSARWWVAYVVAAILAIVTHAFAFSVLLAHVLCLLMLDKRHRPPKVLAWVYGTIGVVAAVIAGLVGPILIDDQRLSWILTPTARSLFDTIGALSGVGVSWRLIPYAALIYAGIAVCVGVWRRRGEGIEAFTHALVVTWALLPIGLSYGLSFVFRPMFVPRYMIVSLAALCLLLARGLSFLRVRQLGAVAFTLVALLTLRGLIDWHSDTDKEDWRGLTADVLSAAQPDDGVVFFHPIGATAFAYYVDRGEAWDRAPAFVYPSFDPGTRRWSVPSFEDAFERLSHRGAAGSDRLWLVSAHLDDRESERRFGSVQAEIDEAYRPIEIVSRPGMFATLYARVDPR